MNSYFNSALSRKLFSLLRSVLWAAGMVFIVILILSFTTLPYWMYYHLGTANSQFRFTPQNIILLGGGGMPSESNLIRAYKTIEVCRLYPQAHVIVALPTDSALKTDKSSLQLLVDFLQENGIDSSKITTENCGNNTREQALLIEEKFHLANQKNLLISSPEHTYRAIGTFRKAGYSYLGGVAAFETALEGDLTFNESKLGGKKTGIPDVGHNLQLRYQFWNHLKYQVIVYREYFAIAYYKLKGWM